MLGQEFISSQKPHLLWNPSIPQCISRGGGFLCSGALPSLHAGRENTSHGTREMVQMVRMNGIRVANLQVAKAVGQMH